MSESYELGKKGEEIALNYLKKNGYQIVEQRWHYHHLELDIIAIDTATNELVAVEVKTRRSGLWGTPEKAVDMKKMRHMVNATDVYMRMNWVRMPVRFDIIAVLMPKGERMSLRHMKDAFYAPLR